MPPSSSSSSFDTADSTTAPDDSTKWFSSSSRTAEAAKQLWCGGIAGAVAKTVTAPFSRLTILFQVHSLVTTRHHRPKFAMSIRGGMQKIVERGGLLSLWKGNFTSVLHRFPYSAINFFVYENSLDVLSDWDNNSNKHESEFYPPSAAVPRRMKTEKVKAPVPAPHRIREEPTETQRQLVRRVSKIVLHKDFADDEDDNVFEQHGQQQDSQRRTNMKSNNNGNNSSSKMSFEDTPAKLKFLAGALAGTCAVLACYPLDLVRTRLTTELEGHEHYRGIADAFNKIAKTEGVLGFYSGVGPTLLVAVPNFAISYTVYGTLKEYTLDDELFYSFRKIDADSGEPKLGFGLTIMCGAASGFLATMLTFPMDTIRRRMQIQNLHVPDPAERLTSVQQFVKLVTQEGLTSVYRGLTPEIMKVIPMVGTMFVVYEWSKDMLDVTHSRNN